MLEFEEAIQENFNVISKSGVEFNCYCPFHDDRIGGRGNLYINGKTGFYFCHNCHSKGKLDSYIPTPGSLLERVQTMQRDGFGARSAFSHPQTLPDGFLAQFGYKHPYWTDRGLTEATVAKFELGFDITKNHAIIPFRDHVENLIGVIRRTLNDDDPWKYKNPNGILSNHYLFGSHLLEGRRKVALVEGPADALACWNARVPALAVFGSYLSQSQVSLLRRLGVYHCVLMFDNDKPGRQAVYNSFNSLVGFTVSEGVYRPYWGRKDPGELTPQQCRKMYHSSTLMV